MEEYNMEKIWGAVLEGMRLAVSEPTYNMYLRRAKLVEGKDVGERWVGVVGVSSAMIRDNLDLKYKGLITDELSRVIGKKSEISFRIQEAGAKIGEEELGPLFEERKIDGKKANLREDYTFENYAVGASNQMAYAAAQAVGKQPGKAYNPLLIWGGVGVGKTHLMQAIGQAVVDRGEERVLFCTSEQFTNDLVEGIKNKSTDRVRAKYRKMKVLLIDDIQFIAGRGAVQEEFFHTFNALLQEGAQIVTTSDRPPGEITKMEPRLKSRFGAGLVVDIGPADEELRTAILLIKARQRQIDLPIEAAKLAAQEIDGVRELEGFLQKLMASRREGGEITIDEVAKLLKKPERGEGRVRVVTAGEIMEEVAKYYGVSLSLLKGERRTKMVAWPRQILMYLLAKDASVPLVEVGRMLGGRDHSTVIHARDKILAELVDNQKVKAEIEEVRRRIFT